MNEATGVSTATGSDAIGTLEPFTLRPILQERIWGVESLPAFLDQPAPGHPVGEAWLTAESCAIEGASPGPLSGTMLPRTLGEVTARFPTALGHADGGGFPLLLKLLFPREKLSVQVHPNDDQARALGIGRGKTECWYVLEAEPGAEVAVGLREPLPMDEVRRAIAQGTLENKLRYLPVQAGDMVFVDAGTIHAIGPGMTVLETQQYSDTTYRLYDYGRPRELHVDAGLAVSRPSTAAGLVKPVPMDEFTRLASSPYFVVDRYELAAGASHALGKAGELQVLVALHHGCSVQAEAGGRSTPLEAGHACVLPAGLAECSLHASQAGTVIRVAQR